MASHSAQLSGLLPVNKPPGLISKDVSRWLVKRLGRVKLGHVGTLDPAASGVLPMLFGPATRLQDFLLDLPKTYEFDLTLGRETDTLDLDGATVREAPFKHVTAAALQEATSAFLGEIEQIPPLYSAIKYRGKPLYDYARGQSGAGSPVPLESLKRKVCVTRFELLDFRPGIGSFRVTCSKGTYIRTLVKDVAERVGSCGTLTRLVRTRAAGVGLDGAVDLPRIEEALDHVASLVLPIESLELGLQKWRCQGQGVRSKLVGGQQVAIGLEDYLSGVETAGRDQALPSGWAETALLLDECGKAFGIGAIRQQEKGRIVIAMKRGLQ